MPWIVESTRPALKGSAKNPKRKTEKKKIICKDAHKMILAVGSEAIDANRIVITFLTASEYEELK